MSHLCDLFFICNIIFIVINHITYLFFVHFLEYLLFFLGDNVDEASELLSNSKSLVTGCCLAFFANFSLALLFKNVAYKKKRVLCIGISQNKLKNCSKSGKITVK